MSWLKVRTIRGQLTAGFILLEVLFTVLFAFLLVRAQMKEIHWRGERRMEYQSHLLQIESSDALLSGEMERLDEMARVIHSSPTVESVRITDPHGRTLVSAGPSRPSLTPLERAYLQPSLNPIPFRNENGARESVVPLYAGNSLLGYAFLRENADSERAEVHRLIQLSMLLGILGAIGCVIASALLARTITRPLRAVMGATRRLIRDPETKEGFPLVVHGHNEAAELANAFNLLVLSMEEQRAGLSDTLALLDSMLAHAPIGFAFFDRKGRYVRVNQFLAEKTGISMTRYLGRSVEEMFPPVAAAVLQAQLDRVFATGIAVQDFEFHPGALKEESGEVSAEEAEQRSWLVNIYPVKTGHQAVRWVGAVVMDTTERKRSEEALRRTEKLAAAGRLAASIAHEINNPLEAVTNLLYLLRGVPSLSSEALQYTEMAQHEVSRVSEITQQTLRFYRQSTLPAMCSVTELLDSMITLHQGRVHSLHVEIERRYEPRVDLFCLSGGLRQLFANLIGNALDAMPTGGRLVLEARRSVRWRDGVAGVRVVVADTGSGMPEAVRRRIFEPFYTTKEATGTGLGLWVSSEIIQKHKGTVAVKSRPGNSFNGPTGTVFMLFFPEDGMPATMHEIEAAPIAVGV